MTSVWQATYTASGRTRRWATKADLREIHGAPSRAAAEDSAHQGIAVAHTARLMVFKLVMAAPKTWRRLKGENQLSKLVAGVTFQDGTEVVERPSTRAA